MEGFETPGMSSNPYSATFSAPGLTSPLPLGSRSSRLSAAVIDALASMAVGVVCFVLMIAVMALIVTVGGENDQTFLVAGVLGYGLFFMGGLAFLGLQIYLLATRSQTVGKYLTKLQIRDIYSHQPANVGQTVGMRLILNGLIASIPCIGLFYTIVDICYIFADDHRCLHDHIAKTYVVDIR